MRRNSLWAVAIAVGLATAGSVQAQEWHDDGGLERRLATAERQVAMLAQTLDVPHAVPPRAVPVQGQFPQTYAAQVEVRLTELETTLQRLNGRVEELQFAVRQAEQRLDRALTDVEFRLTELEGGDPFATGDAGGGGLAAAPASPGLDLQTSVIGGQGATPPPGNTQIDTSSGVLGTLNLTPQRPTLGGDTQVAVIASDPATGDYDQAFALLQRADYAAAELALSDFLAEHARHPLASNAHYWLGETFYVRGRFEEAAGAFARGYQSFPRGSRAVDSLLKLGMSLAQLGQRNEACLTFTQLGQEFPNAALAVQRRAEQERLRLACP